MNELFVRQIAILRNLVDQYRDETIGLNALIQRVEGIGGVLGIAAWDDAVFPVILSLEQINAVTLEARKTPTEAERISIENSLLELEAIMSRFEAG